jgi:nucleoside phosphorylase
LRKKIEAAAGEELGVAEGLVEPLAVGDAVVLEGLAWAKMLTAPNEGPTITKRPNRAPMKAREKRATRRALVADRL